MASIKILLSVAGYEFQLASLSRPAKSSTQERNLQDYREAEKDLRFPDLSQYPKNHRGRGECKDNTLMTLTTQSGKIYSEAGPLFQKQAT